MKMHFSTSLAISALLELAAAATCPASGPPVYPRATENNTAFIPFINKFPDINTTPSLTFTVMTKDLETLNRKAVNIKSAGMDTGSTGVMIGAGVLGFDEKTPFDKSKPGNEYLSSSGRLWQGYWVDANLTFPAMVDERTIGEDVVASVPILIVTEASICRAWKTQGSCTEAQKSNITMYPKDIHYMGVGFGRWSSEQPDALPDKVSLINIASIGGRPVKSTIHQGYVLGKDGVEVGLTSENTEGFCKTQLDVRSGSNSTIDWNMVNMAIKVNDSPYDHGPALFDTGIPQAFLRVNKDVRSHFKNVTSKAIKTHPQVAAKGTVVVVHIPNEKNPIATYNVTAQGAGKPNPATMQPSGFVLEDPPVAPNVPFINTGRMFYNGFDALFDSACGWFGLAELEETSAKRVKRATCPS